MADKVEFIVTAKDDASKAIDKIKGGFEGVTSTIKKVVGALAIMEAGKWAVQTVKDLADTGEQLDKMSKATGISVKSLSALKQTAGEMNTPIETVTMGIKKMQMSMGDLDGEGKKTRQALNVLGLSFDALSNQKPEEQFMNIGNSIAKITDPATKTALAMQFFGKAGMELIPFFNEGNTSMEEMMKHAEKLGVAFDEDMMKKAMAADDAFDNLEGTWKGLMTTIGVTLAPVLVQIIQGISQIIQWAMNWKQALQDVLNYVQSTWGVNILAIWETVKNSLMAVWDWINSNVLPKIMQFFADIMGEVTEHQTNFINAWQIIKNAVAAVWSELGFLWDQFWANLRFIFEVAWALLSGAILTAMDIFNGDWLGAWEHVKETANSIWLAIEQLATDTFNNLLIFIQNVLQAIGVNFDDAKSVIFGIWDGMWSAIEAAVNAVVQRIVAIVDGVTSSIRNALSALSDLAKKAAGTVLPKGSSGMSHALEGRAVGGSVNAGQPYMVGEYGPEIFTPKSSGSITPNHKLGSSVVININGPVSSKDVAMQYANIILRELQLHSQVI